MDTLKAVITYLCQIDIDSYILLATAFAALYSIHRNTVINRRRATVDLVLHQKNDTDLKAANVLVNPLLHEQNITKYSNKEHVGSAETKAIFAVLNNYEFIATGIKEKTFDLALYKRMKFGMVMRDWEEFRPFIYDVRNTRSHPTLYQEFEWLAKQFKNKPLKPNSKD